jgi:hypothetical protein
MIADLYGLYFIGFFFLRFRPMNARLRRHVRWLLKLPMSAANAINPFANADPNYVSDFYFKQLAAAWDHAPGLKPNKPKKPGKETKTVYLKSTTTASSHQKEEVSSAGDKTQMYMG